MPTMPARSLFVAHLKLTAIRQRVARLMGSVDANTAFPPNAYEIVVEALVFTDELKRELEGIGQQLLLERAHTPPPPTEPPPAA